MGTWTSSGRQGLWEGVTHSLAEPSAVQGSGTPAGWSRGATRPLFSPVGTCAPAGGTRVTQRRGARPFPGVWVPRSHLPGGSGPVYAQLSRDLASWEGRREGGGCSLGGWSPVHVSTCAPQSCCLPMGPLGPMTLRRPNTLLWNAPWSYPRLGHCNPTDLFFLILPGGKFQVCKPTVTWFGVLGFVPVPTEMFFSD